MQQRQINKPVTVNIDKSKKYLSPQEAFFMLNRERNINGTGTLGKTTPLIANYLACLITQPAGTNHTCGKYFSELTNELYWWTINSNGVNYIARINSDGSCQIVYDGNCLPLSADPKHSIENWRCYLKYDRFCAHQHGKQLIWTDGVNEIGQIDVEASIATNSFTTPFFDVCTDDCAPVQMCVPEPCGPLQGEFITLQPSEVHLNNHIVDIGIKVRFRWIYYDQRASEWSDISTLYFLDSKGCFDLSEGYSRCMNFTIPLGNPLVDKIEFAVSTDNGINWESYDIIEKYKPYSSTAQYWYERELEDLTDLDLVNCTFSYIFCNDKECNPIDPKETSRVFNPMPRQPQGLIRIKDSLGFYNYVKGTCPIDGTEAKKLEIGIDCNAAGNCVVELAEVTVYAIIHNRADVANINALIYREGGNAGDPDDINDYAMFGFTPSLGQSSWLTPIGMGQYFKDKKVRNFIAYVEGTNYWGEMEQWLAAPYFTSSRKVGLISGMAQSGVAGAVTGQILSGSFYYQQYKFKVPKGTKGFVRIASQKVNEATPLNGQETSTFVVGTIPDIHAYLGFMDISSMITNYKEEIYFDTCAGDTVVNETIIIDNNYTLFGTGGFGAHSSSAYAGYLTDANNKPVEGAELWSNGGIRAITDFNGFYHFWMYGNVNEQTINVDVRVETNCGAGFNTVKTVVMDGRYNNLFEMDIQITDVDFAAYKSDFYKIVNVSVTDCNALPVGGIRVSLSGSKYEVSDDITGIATFHIRNYSTRARYVRGVIMDTNGCFSQDCSSSCNPCLPQTGNIWDGTACFSGKPTMAMTTDTNLNKDISLLNKKGLKSGGRYPFGFVVQGDCGRISPVYPATVLSGSLPQMDNFMNIPKTQEKGILNFCSFTYRSNSMVLPSWANCLKIVRGENINNYELQWIVDKIERTRDNKIKLTIQSLNDYNAEYNFETNTIYQYAKNDRVEFINNGDGAIFDISTNGLLNYQILSPFHDKIISGQTNAPADFFNQILIHDDGKLDNLTVGAKIELQRPKDCTVEPTYYEILSLPLIDISGQKMIATPNGTFTTFDTYIVFRQIAGNVSQQFEHKFPSDFWGQKNANGVYSGISDIGKVHFINKYENEKRVGRNITINSVNQFNRFGDIEKVLDAPYQGDLTAMAIYDGKIGLGIGEFDNFLFVIADDYLRIDNTGIVKAAPADSILSDTQPKVSGIFGCKYDSIGSVFFGDGFALWVDTSKAAYVKHDFNTAKDISEGKFNTWVKQRCQFIENFNTTAGSDLEKFRFITGFNFHTNALQLTVKALNQDGINNEQELFSATNDTILIEPRTEELLTLASYTPEAYSNIKLSDSKGCAFVSFLNGIPYIHPIMPLSLTTGFNEFFGKAVDSIVAFAINTPPDKIKNPMALEIQDETMWFALKIEVDESSFDSEIPAIRWKKEENKWNAEFLCDKNSRGGLYGRDAAVAGTKPRGYFCAVTLVRDNTDSLKYGTHNDVKRVAFDELDLIISKYSVSEQSGFTENV